MHSTPRDAVKWRFSNWVPRNPKNPAHPPEGCQGAGRDQAGGLHPEQLHVNPAHIPQPSIDCFSWEAGSRKCSLEFHSTASFSIEHYHFLDRYLRIIANHPLHARALLRKALLTGPFILGFFLWSHHLLRTCLWVVSKPFQHLLRKPQQWRATQSSQPEGWRDWTHLITLRLLYFIGHQKQN